nr:immunoglobulin heavy chain junction region [Macaca mulatta]MOW23161.1 immunoglobulin heavy chain junction region [Macaca mulatta]MOW23276.1 immunoglobulin heavy chain junction region [Macaca mulatta]MOW23300.1 immunoglobulin heavy chain junction region [Macaca mulatta]MOW23513.1 immunoglobulin heavy chain junction region [Macaca mulatta]
CTREIRSGWSDLGYFGLDSW